ncbi:MAG TPA: hypothetical protein VNK95_18730 [Caldilineaceae bacterium]|nr:hypothetical protein [Caldilineaceae bacterium]
MAARNFCLLSVLGPVLAALMLWLTGCAARDAAATPPAVAGDPASIARLPRPAPPLPQTPAAVTPVAATPAITPAALSVPQDSTEAAATMAPAMPMTATVMAIDLPTGTLPAGGSKATPVAEPVLLPTPTPTRAAPVLPTPTATANLPTAGDLSAVVPTSYRARGAFDSITTFPDGTVQQQQGEFEITRVAAAHRYGVDESYLLTTTGPSGEAGAVVIYQIGESIATRFAEGEWVVTERSQGSGLVKAIQPIADLAAAFLRVREQAEPVGSEEIGGAPTRHYRIADPALFAELFGRSPAQGAGTVTALRFDAWLAEPQGYVLRYDFRLEVSGARVLDDRFQEVAADQVVAWSYELLEVDSGLALAWPKDAPLPGMIQAPGFAPGEFPIPPDTEVVSTYAGIPELVSTRPLEEVSRFYEEQLAALGWTVEGAYGLYRCSKNGVSFQLLITAEEATGGSRVSILPAE